MLAFNSQYLADGKIANDFIKSEMETLRHTVVDSDAATSFFVRQGPVAAQVLLTSGHHPRLVTAFVAGNSGAGVWFEACNTAVSLQAESGLSVHACTDAQGRTLHGVVIDLQANATQLSVRRGLLGSVRVLRDHQSDGRLPAAGVVAPQADAEQVCWSRDRIDGAPGYRQSLEMREGGTIEQHGDTVVLHAAPGSTTLHFTLCAYTGDTPLHPLNAAELFNGSEVDLPGARASLLFLGYRENLLAGSWRFHNYFGRDTLMALRMLLPVLQPAAIEDILGSVLRRTSVSGEVAHEEDIAEFALLHRLAHGQPMSDAPILDYKMVDDDFMLAPVVAAYLLETPAGSERAADFLAHTLDTPHGPSTVAALLVRNMACVLAKAQPFALAPSVRALVRLKAGEIVGDWRDSGDGLGGGVYAYGVNAVLVPAALRAVQALLASGHFASHITDPAALSAPLAASMASTWETAAPPLFDLRIPQTQAQAQVAQYAASLGVPCPPDWAHGLDGPLVVSALSLDDAGQALPILQSDFGFALLFAQPSPERLEHELRTMLRPFPAGLMTDAGMVVANPVFADARLQKMFGRDCYHGAVVWSWQQAMAVAGLARQLQRQDLPDTTRAALTQAQNTLWHCIQATREVAEGELWSWRYADGQYQVQSFGPLCVTADESNAAQLWSTVYLAVQPPASVSVPVSA